MKKNIILTLFRQSIGFLVGISISSIIARQLGPINNGYFAMAILISSTLSTVLDFGISSANVFF